jgi:translation initiation factor IF-2
VVVPQGVDLTAETYHTLSEDQIDIRNDWKDNVDDEIRGPIREIDKEKEEVIIKADEDGSIDHDG